MLLIHAAKIPLYLPFTLFPVLLLRAKINTQIVVQSHEFVKQCNKTRLRLQHRAV